MWGQWAHHPENLWKVVWGGGWLRSVSDLCSVFQKSLVGNQLQWTEMKSHLLIPFFVSSHHLVLLPLPPPQPLYLLFLLLHVNKSEVVSGHCLFSCGCPRYQAVTSSGTRTPSLHIGIPSWPHPTGDSLAQSPQFTLCLLKDWMRNSSRLEVVFVLSFQFKIFLTKLERVRRRTWDFTSLLFLSHGDGTLSPPQREIWSCLGPLGRNLPFYSSLDSGPGLGQHLLHIARSGSINKGNSSEG